MPLLQTVFHWLILAGPIAAVIGWPNASASEPANPSRPNILIAISDDQSWPHASAYGSRMVRTPNFDRVAGEGVLFTQGFCASPGCSPSRAALLTGYNTWQLEHAGTHASYFDPKFRTYVDQLSDTGYTIGSTGKGWGPGDFRALGRPHNPAGPNIQGARSEGDERGYADAFRTFLDERPPNAPFCFWFGSVDPHRSYEKGSGLAAGKSLEDAEVPPFLPDVPEIRSDLLDYALEIERFDRDLGNILTILEEAGELDRTLVIVTSDNGMPFPRAKANGYEFGIHVPLAIRWGDAAPPGRVVDDLVGFTDLTATIYEATGVSPPDRHLITGRSLLTTLRSEDDGLVDPTRDAVYAARERHSSSRYNSLSYPQRCLRTPDYLYILNLKPERWPAGPARKYDEVVYDESGQVVRATLGPPNGAYHDIDACPTLTYFIENRDDPVIARYLELAVARRPREELFDVRNDPACLTNLADDPAHVETLVQLRDRLRSYLEETGDVRILGEGDVWETYLRTSPLRWFPIPDWARDHPEHVPTQPWLDDRRPR